jgi:hypothetical protein
VSDDRDYAEEADVRAEAEREGLAEQAAEVSDEDMHSVIAYHETVLDGLIDVFRELRARDRAAGEDTDIAALGGLGIAFEMLGPTSRSLIGPLAVRRLAEVVTRG